jgi:hypothetical protein
MRRVGAEQALWRIWAFFAFNKQAFANYYFWVLLCCFARWLWLCQPRQIMRKKVENKKVEKTADGHYVIIDGGNGVRPTLTCPKQSAKIWSTN